MSPYSPLPNFPLRLDYDSFVTFTKRVKISRGGKCVPSVYTHNPQQYIHKDSRYPQQPPDISIMVYPKCSSCDAAINEHHQNLGYDRCKKCLYKRQDEEPVSSRKRKAGNFDPQPERTFIHYHCPGRPEHQQRGSGLKTVSKPDIAIQLPRIRDLFSDLFPPVRNEGLRSQVTQPVDCNSINPSISPSLETNSPPRPPAQLTPALNVQSIASIATELLEGRMKAGGQPQGQNCQSTYQARQDSDTASPGSFATVTGPYDPQHHQIHADHHIHADSPHTIADDTPETETVPHHSKCDAPYAPGPPLKGWVQKYYDHYKWNQELGYLKCTACGETRTAPSFERTENHYELLPTCTDCRNQNKRENRDLSKNKGDKGGKKDKKNTDGSRICWNITESAGCGRKQASAEFEIDQKQWSGHLARALCKSCRAEKIRAQGPPEEAKPRPWNELEERVAEYRHAQALHEQSPAQHLRPRPQAGHAAQRPSGRGVAQEHMNYTSRSYCKACRAYQRNADFDLVWFKKYEGEEKWWRYPREYCRRHDEGGGGGGGGGGDGAGGGADRPIFKVCPSCRRNWHSGQFGPIIVSDEDGAKRDPWCYNCLENGPPVPSEDDKDKAKGKGKSKSKSKKSGR